MSNGGQGGSLPCPSIKDTARLVYHLPDEIALLILMALVATTMRNMTKQNQPDTDSSVKVLHRGWSNRK